MRDLRSDLQERADWLDEQIQTAQAQFDKYVEQLKAEHDNRVKDLKAELEAVNALLGIEHRRHTGAPAALAAQPQPQAQPQRPRPQQPLADFLIRKLSEGGPMSKDGIQIMTVKEGYFADGDAERACRPC